MDLEIVGQRCCALTSHQIGHLTQVVREALSNAVRHAEASRIAVSLSYLATRTRLVVQDDGRGADLGSPAGGETEGQGIANMQARARLLGGDLQVESRPGHGFAVTLTIPCGDQRPEKAGRVR